MILIVALLATLVASAQTIKVYEYDAQGKLISISAQLITRQNLKINRLHSLLWAECSSCTCKEITYHGKYSLTQDKILV